MRLLTLLFLSSIFTLNIFAAETCSRIAIVNYQEVLVDPSATTKGEGLRFFLEKDKVANELLEEYQKQNTPKWQTSALSTFGTGLILGGILKSSSEESSGFTSKDSLIFTGGALIAISYLISKTILYKNEFILQRSIEEYNKRNRPRIYFSPFIDANDQGSGVGVGVQKEF